MIGCRWVCRVTRVYQAAQVYGQVPSHSLQDTHKKIKVTSTAERDVINLFVFWVSFL